MAICLKDEQPIFVAKESDRYVFWYRRALYPMPAALVSASSTGKAHLWSKSES